MNSLLGYFLALLSSTCCLPPQRGPLMKADSSKYHVCKSYPEADKTFVLIYQGSGSVIGPVLNQLQWLGDGNVLHALVQITCYIPGARDKIGSLEPHGVLGGVEVDICESNKKNLDVLYVFSFSLLMQILLMVCGNLELASDSDICS